MVDSQNMKVVQQTLIRLGYLPSGSDDGNLKQADRDALKTALMELSPIIEIPKTSRYNSGIGNKFITKIREKQEDPNAMGALKAYADGKGFKAKLEWWESGLAAATDQKTEFTHTELEEMLKKEQGFSDNLLQHIEGIRYIFKGDNGQKFIDAMNVIAPELNVPVPPANVPAPVTPLVTKAVASPSAPPAETKVVTTPVSTEAAPTPPAEKPAAPDTVPAEKPQTAVAPVHVTKPGEYEVQGPGHYVFNGKVKHVQELMAELKKLKPEAAIDLATTKNKDGNDGFYGDKTRNSIIATEKVLGIAPSDGKKFTDVFVKQLEDKVKELTPAKPAATTAVQTSEDAATPVPTPATGAMATIAHIAAPFLRTSFGKAAIHGVSAYLDARDAVENKIVHAATAIGNGLFPTVYAPERLNEIKQAGAAITQPAPGAVIAAASQPALQLTRTPGS